MADIVNKASLPPSHPDTHAEEVKTTHGPAGPASTMQPTAAIPSGRARSRSTPAHGQRGRRSRHVAVWLVAGFGLALGLVHFLLLGILITAAFRTLVRRRPLRTLLDRDTATFAKRWPGKVLVAAVLVLIPASMVAGSVSGDRYGRYADDSWKALLMLSSWPGATSPPGAYCSPCSSARSPSPSSPGCFRPTWQTPATAIRRFWRTSTSKPAGAG